MTATERPVAILFADVSGSTTLYERLGDREALRAVESVLDILRRNVAAYRGRVVKTIGDEVMAAFPDADGALQAASDMQNGVASLPAFGDVRLAIRVGFHYGPALEDKADFFGDAVNTAARMAGLAKAGQIITTAATVAALAPLLRASTREVAALAVKGKQDAVQVCEVLWQPDAEVTMLAPKHVAAATEPVLKLSHGARTLVMDSATGAVQIGRDASNTFAVSDRMASRLHGRPTAPTSRSRATPRPCCVATRRCCAAAARSPSAIPLRSRTRTWCRSSARIGRSRAEDLDAEPAEDADGRREKASGVRHGCGSTDQGAFGRRLAAPARRRMSMPSRRPSNRES